MPCTARSGTARCHPPAVVPPLHSDPLAALAAAGVVPVVAVDDAATAVTLGRLLVERGLPVIEITFPTDAAATRSPPSPPPCPRSRSSPAPC